MPPYELIEDAGGVAALARDLRREPVLGIDTEADSFFHYYDKLCLLQIATPRKQYLIDPIALGKGLAPLAPLLEDPGVRKVLHAAEYDLFVLQRYGGFRIRNLFDTMVSAQLLGYPAVGLAALVSKHFDVVLSKDQQRTDWSRRPLRPEQLEYAAADVAYLIELARILEEELRAKSRQHWAASEFEALEERVWPEREFDNEGYLKIKGARKLQMRNLAVLRELYLMRDKRARDLDKPPFKVLGNGTLLELAQRPPTSRRALARRKGVTDLVIRRHGEDVLEAVGRGMDGPEHPPLERRTNGARRRLDRRGELSLERLKRWRARRAAELEMDPGVFCPNAALEEIVLEMPERVVDLQKLDHVKAWWANAFGEELLQALEHAQAEAGALAARPEPRVDGAAVGGSAGPPRRRSRRRRGGRSRPAQSS